MSDNNEQNENPMGEELAGPEAKVAELEGLVAQKDEEIRLANARIGELEQVVTGLESEATTLKQAMVESDENLKKLNERLALAVASYKKLVVEANPGVIEELVTGDTIEDINRSLEGAKSLIGKVRQGLEAEITAAKVPAGAPQRTPIDLSALSPREKIQYAIGGKR